MSMRLPACGRMALRGWRTCGEGKKERKKKERERERRDGDAGVQAEESVGGEELYSEGAVERKEGRREGRRKGGGRKEGARREGGRNEGRKL